MTSNTNENKDKSTFLALTFYVLSIVALAFYSSVYDKDNLYQLVDHKLLDAAQIAPLLLNKDLHQESINKDSLSLDDYKKNMLKLSHYASQHKITYIYTLILKDNKIFFSSSSATNRELQSKKDIPTFFDEYYDVDPRIFDVFKHKETLFIDEHMDRWGTFRSIFIPVEAEDGSIYVAAADISIDSINAKLLNQRYITIAISLLFILFAYPIYFFATKKIKRLVKKLSQQVQAQTVEINDKTERLQLAMRVSKQGWFDFNISSGEMSVSDEYPRLLGFTPQSFQSNMSTWRHSIHPEDRETVLNVFKTIIAGKDPKEVEYRTKNKEGQWLWIHSMGQVTEWDKNKKPYRVIGVHADISERKRSEQVLRTLAESGSAADEGIFQQMVQELVASQNVRYALIATFDNTKVDHLTTLAVCADNEKADNFSYPYDPNTPCGHVINNDKSFFPKDLQKLFSHVPIVKEFGVVSYLGTSLRNSLGENIGVLAILDNKPMKEDLRMQDLLGSFAVRVSIELERRESNKQLTLSSRVFESAHEGIMITDANKQIVDINPEFTTISGYSHDEAVGQSLCFLDSGKYSDEFFDSLWEAVDQQGYWQGELWCRRKGGELYAELLTISVITDDEGEIQNYVGLFSDITKSKEQQASLELMAHYDVLTGLPNRSLFADRYKQAVAHSKRSDTLLAVCFLDLDDFKPVNDLYGHMVGDQLLIKVAERIKIQIRAEDTVSRLGGDEFVFLLGDLTSQAQCEQILKRLHETIAKPYQVEGHEVKVSASSGVILHPKNEDEKDLDTLLRHADQAMYQAKLSGRNQYQFFDSLKNQYRANKQEQLKEIHRAIVDGEMQLYYQPKVNMRTGIAFGVEALIRWVHPQRGIILPADFLPIIESSELEITVGEWVLNTALKQLSAWNKLGLFIEVSVNISSYHLQSSSFISQLELILSNYPEVDSTHIQLEILESSTLGDLKAISSVINYCRHTLGLNIALDDFGTGYSSLTHLRNLSANTIKIDQSFVRDILDNTEDSAIIEGVIGLAKAFDREVIAEGLETVESGLLLLAMGCDHAQGYGIARPMPSIKVIDWVKNYQPEQQWMEYNKEKKTVIEAVI